jgi:flagellar biosynthetic protein FliO
MATASTLGLFVRLILSLGVVIGLMWAAATMLKRRGLASGPGRRATRGVQVELLARRSLGRNAAITVVRVGDRSMVLGVTDHQVTKLDDVLVEEIDLEEGAIWTAPSGASTGPATAWKTMLEQMRKRTARH